MLKLMQSMEELRFSELMDVYEETNKLSGEEHYFRMTKIEQIYNARIDFYHYLKSVFFRQKNSFCVVWEENGVYQSALRLEPYRDGYLICALETAPHLRGRGSAKKLIQNLQAYLTEKGSGLLYSHVSKKNAASLAVHRKCGFNILTDYAVYSDGSVLQNTFTLSYEY